MVLKINKLFSIIVFIMFFIVLIFYNKTTFGVKNGIDLCVNILIPTLLPFTVLSLMFLKSGGLLFLSKILGVKLSIWLLSSIGGYPAGALIIKQLRNNNTDLYLKNAVLYSVNAGPAFVIAAIGANIFNNISIGIVLLFSHLFISFLFCVFSKKINASFILKQPTKSPISILFDSLEQGLISTFKICGMVIFVSCFFELIKDIELLKYISLIFEVTVGVAMANKNLYLIAFLISFSGISVILQIKMILKDLISFKTLLLQRLLHGILTTSLLWILLYFFPISIETLSNKISFDSKTSYVSCASGIALIFMCLVFISQILRQKNNRGIHG